MNKTMFDNKKRKARLGVASPTKGISPLAVALLWAASAFPAHACMSTQQPILRKHMVSTANGTVELVVLDLLTLSLPGRSLAGWRVIGQTGDTPILRELTPDQLASALQSKKFVTATPRSVGDPLKRTSLAQRHFGAVGIGTARLEFVNDLQKPPVSYRVNVTVGARQWPEVPSRGSLVTFDQTGQGKMIGLQYYDTLEIVLPGTRDDNWVVDADGAGLVLSEKRHADDGKMKFFFKVTSAQGIRPLIIKHATGAGISTEYTFPIRHMPTPLC